MGPTCSRRSTTRSSSSSSTRKSRRTIQKKKLPAAEVVKKSKIAESTAVAFQPCTAGVTPTKDSNNTTTNSFSSLSIDHGVDFGMTPQMEKSEYCSTSPCATPKSEKFRIPEIQTCPPAPKKRRVLGYSSLRRRPINFFSPPDVELFFFVDLRDIPAA